MDTSSILSTFAATSFALLNPLSIKIDRPELSPEDVKRLKEDEAKAAAGRE
jgi:hypothetical protein